MRRPRPDAGYMLMIILIFGIVMTALGAVLLWPTRSALVRAESMEARLAARQAARSGLELALEDPRPGAAGEGALGHATYRYRVEAGEDSRLSVHVTGLASAGGYEEEAVLETVVRIAEDGAPVHETWRLYTRRARP